jgi:hypothetical protein
VGTITSDNRNSIDVFASERIGAGWKLIKASDEAGCKDTQGIDAATDYIRRLWTADNTDGKVWLGFVARSWRVEKVARAIVGSSRRAPRS